MKWALVAIVLLQAPFLFIVFVMAGTDGKRESLLAVWRWVIPLAICSALTLILAVLRREWGVLEWAVALVACLLTLPILARSVLR